MLSDFLHVLLGAALVAVGVLASALADRIRGVKLTRQEAAPRAPRADRADRQIIVPAAEPTRVVEVVEKRARLPRISATDGGLADDVITALVAAGFKKPIATDATWSCTQEERATVEDWTRAALRRCARGGAS